MVREYAPSGTEVYRNQPKFSVITEYLRQYLTYTLTRLLVFLNVPPKENGEGPNGSGILRIFLFAIFFYILIFRYSRHGTLHYSNSQYSA